MFSWLLFISLGIFVGAVSGLFGIGGGVIMVPALLFAVKKLGVSDSYAIFMATRTSLAVILFTSFYSAFNHNKRNPLNKRVLLELAAFVIMGTILGALFVRQIKAETLELILLIYISLIGIKMWFGFKVDESRKASAPMPINFLVGNIIGIKSAILGIGGGTISIPYLTWRNVPMTQAVGISAALGFIIALTGTVSTLINPENVIALPKYTYGYIYFPGVIGILSTSLLFARVGAHYAHKIPQEKLRKVFALLLMALALKEIISFIEF